MAVFVIIIISVSLFSPACQYLAVFFKIIPVTANLQALSGGAAPVLCIIIPSGFCLIPAPVCCPAALELIMLPVDIQLLVCHKTSIFIIIKPVLPFLAEPVAHRNTIFIKIVPLFLNLDSLTGDFRPFNIIMPSVTFFYPSI